MTITLRDLLNDGKVHVLDGAMGTMLYSKGFFLNVCYDELSVKQPKLVQEVHEAYVRAGARSEEHTSELQSRSDLVCRLLLEKKKKNETKENIELVNVSELQRVIHVQLKMNQN